MSITCIYYIWKNELEVIFTKSGQQINFTLRNFENIIFFGSFFSGFHAISPLNHQFSTSFIKYKYFNIALSPGKLRQKVKTSWETNFKCPMASRPKYGKYGIFWFGLAQCWASQICCVCLIWLAKSFNVQWYEIVYAIQASVSSRSACKTPVQSSGFQQNVLSNFLGTENRLFLKPDYAPK